MESNINDIKILENLHEGIWILDKETFITYINSACAEMLGYSAIEMAGKQFINFVDESNLSICRQKFEKIKKGSREVVDLQLITKSGKRLQVNFKMSPMFSSEDTFIGVMSTVCNVPNIMEHNHLCGLNKIGSCKLLFNVPIGTCIVLPNGKLEDVNDIFLQITGYSREEIFNIPIQNFTHPDDREMNFKFINKVIDGSSDDCELEKRYVRKDGNIRWVKMFVMPARNSDRDLLYSIVMVKDITEEKESREKLLRTERMAEIGKMISYMSHAVKSPVSVIEMNIDFLSRQFTENNVESNIIAVIRKELNHIDYLIKDVLNYSRHNNLHSVKINIHEKIETIVQNLQPVLISKQIKIINKINGQFIFADAQKIHTLFLNLIENSIESIGIVGIIELSSECSDDSDLINIFIRDTGAGCANPENVFKPFYTTKSFGTGMGLPIAKNLVEDHNGTLEIMRAEPGDTIFKITLPLAK